MKTAKIVAIIAALTITLSTTSMVATAATGDTAIQNTTASYTVPGGNIGPVDASWVITIPTSVEMNSVYATTEATITLTNDGETAYSGTNAVEVAMASQNNYTLFNTNDEDDGLAYQVYTNNADEDILDVDTGIASTTIATLKAANEDSADTHNIDFKLMSEGTTGSTYKDILTFTCTETDAS